MLLTEKELKVMCLDDLRIHVEECVKQKKLLTLQVSKVEEILEDRYAGELKAAQINKLAGKSTLHTSNEGVRVVANVEKRVDWDSEKLKDIRAIAPKEFNDNVKIKFTVPESFYAISDTYKIFDSEGQPINLKELLNTARDVKYKPSLSIEKAKE